VVKGLYSWVMVSLVLQAAVFNIVLYSIIRINSSVKRLREN